MKKLIMHYDMDAFYASIEIRDRPYLEGKAVIVGQKVITTCNYEARKYGLHSAMSVVEAKKLCPFGIYLPVDKKKYSKEAGIIKELILKLSNKVEFIALDEGFVDISSYKNRNLDSFAKKFIDRIYANRALTCSVGIGYNKLSAKLASEVKKPGGYYIIRNQDEFKRYVYNKDIKILPGIGKKTQKVLREKGINIVSDILSYTLLELQALFGNIKGQLIYEYALGIDYRKFDNDSRYKSIGNEITYNGSIGEDRIIFKNLDDIFDKVFFRLEKKKWYAKTISIKIRYKDRHTITKSKSLKKYSNKKLDFIKIYDEVKNYIFIENEIILLGVSISNIVEEENRQLTFEPVGKLKKRKLIKELKDKINYYEDIFSDKKIR